jgi:mannonate dehydratase
MLNRDNYRFAKQAGCSHIVAHLLVEEERAKYLAGGHYLWTEEELAGLKSEINAEGLSLAAIENFDPVQWYDILLDGPRKKEQLEDIKTLIRRVGKVGIPTIGYDFSIAGVWGHIWGPYGRGGAVAPGFLGPRGPEEIPIPKGEVWNMVYDPDAPVGDIGTVSSEELWGRLEEFLKEVIPVAEEAGVILAAHPDDPPMPTIRGTARLVYQPHHYQRLLDIVPSKSNGLEFCMGSIQEMSEGDIYEALDTYSQQGAIAYIHFRNVIGKVPEYREVFLDEGDIDMIAALGILQDNGFDGVMIPDHTPYMSCDAPWHAGMAFALGYMRAAVRMVQERG